MSKNCASDSRIKSLLNSLLLLGVVIAIFGLIVDIKNTLQYGGIDLRNRVVGARALIEGLDPYFFKWDVGISERLLDPLDHPNQPTSRVTVAPPVLALHAIIAPLPYFHQKLIWLLTQWGAFLFSVQVLIKQAPSSNKRKLVFALGLFFWNGLFWRLHIERGQFYIIYIALLSLAYLLLNDSSGSNQKQRLLKNVLGGILIGYVAGLRLLFILVFVPFLLYRKWAVLVGGIVGGCAAVVQSSLIGGFAVWSGYFLAVSGITNQINLQRRIARPNAVESLSYPDVIEGMRNLTKSSNMPNASTSISSLLSDVGIVIDSKLIVISLFFVLLGMVFLALTLLRKSKPSMSLIFLLGILMYLVTEFFIPIRRDTYNDIQWLLPLAIIAIETDTREFLTNQRILILLMGLFLSLGCFIWISSLHFLKVSVFLLLLYVSLSTLTLLRRDNRDSLAQPYQQRD